MHRVSLKDLLEELVVVGFWLGQIKSLNDYLGLFLLFGEECVRQRIVLARADVEDRFHD